MCSVSRLLLVLLTLAGRSAAEPPVEPPAAEPPSLFAIARDAVKAESVEKTRMLGNSVVDKQFRELPAEGAVLVGFDLGVGNLDKRDDAIYAVRPIYRTERGEFFFQKFGLFPNDRADDGAPSKATKTIKVKAKSGYAVGAITLRTEAGIRGITVTFMKVDGAKLDPRQSYTSDWVGARNGGKEETVSGNGAPIVGVFGNRDDYELLGLGLVTLPGDSSESKDPKSEPAEVEEEVEPPPAETPEGINWIPYVVFGVVTVPIGLFLFLVRGRKSGAPEIENARKTPELLRGRLKADPQSLFRAEYEKYVSSASCGFANASLVIGVFGLFAWCIPIVGVPLTLSGVVFGIRAINSDYQTKAVIGTILSLIGLLLAGGNAALGFMMMSKGMHPMLK